MSNNETVTQNVSSAATKTAAAGIVLQTYCTEVARQAQFDIPSSIAGSLPNLNAYLTTAKHNANYYLGTVQPQIIGVVADVSAYSTQFLTFYDEVRRKIDVWKTGSADAKKEAISLIRATQSNVILKTQKAADVQKVLAAFQVKIDTDAAGFAEGLTAASIVVGGNTGRLATLSHQIENLNKQIAGATAGVVLGVLGTVGGFILIGVGTMATLPTAGLSTALVLIGVILIAGGIGATAAASTMLHKAKGERNALLTEQGTLNALMTHINAIKGTATTLAHGAQDASIQVTTMRNAWNLLGNDLESVCSTLESAASWQGLPVGMQAWLATAESGWASVRERCGIIEKQMSGVSAVEMKDANGQLVQLTQENIRRFAERTAA